MVLPWLRIGGAIGSVALAGYAAGKTGLPFIGIEGLIFDSYAKKLGATEHAQMTVPIILETQKEEFNMDYENVPEVQVSHLELYKDSLENGWDIYTKLNDSGEFATNKLNRGWKTLLLANCSFSVEEGRLSKNGITLRPRLDEPGYGVGTLIHELGHVYLNENGFAAKKKKEISNGKNEKETQSLSRLVELYEEGIPNFLAVETLDKMGSMYGSIRKKSYTKAHRILKTVMLKKGYSSIDKIPYFHAYRYHFGYVLMAELMKNKKIPEFVNSLSFISPEEANEILFKEDFYSSLR